MLATLHPTWRRLTALVCCLALMAAACGSDDDTATESGDSPDPEATSEPTEPEAPEPEPEPTEEPVSLTASDVGVTPETIKLGVVLFDLEAILALGVDVGYGDQTQHIQVAVDDINAAGGINGRMIEVVYREVSPVLTIESDEACVQLVQDEEVFMVLGTQRPAANVFCYTQLYETPFIGSFSEITEDVFEQSDAPLIFTGTRPSRGDNAIYAAMDLRGAIEGETIGLLGRDQARLDGLAAGLEERGAAKVITAVETATETDMIALGNEIDTILERFDADAVTQVLNTGNSVAVLAAFNRRGYDVSYWTTQLDVLADFIYDQGATDAELALTKLISQASIGDLYESGHQPTVDCVDRWNEARPDEVALTDPGDDDLTNLGVVVAACQYVDIFARTATLAGPDLTHESFLAALDDLGEFETAGMTFASLSSTKWDANDSAALYEWDEAEGGLVVTEQIALD